MEILAEILFFLLRLVAEILLQFVMEMLVELGLRSLPNPFARQEALHPLLEAVGYAIVGAFAGWLTLAVFPDSFMKTGWARMAALLFSPLAAGAAMAAFGAWRRRREQDLIRLDTFCYGFIFAFAMALVRFIWAR